MIITSPHFNRPEFTAPMLESLSAVRGIDKHRVIFSLDCPKDSKVDKGVAQLLYAFDKCERQIHYATNNIGCNLHTLKMFTLGFLNNNEEWILHLEDDILLAPDSLEMIEDIIASKPADNICSISLFNRTLKDEVNGRYKTINKRQWFTPSGIVLRRSAFILSVERDCYVNRYISWDVNFNTMRKDENMYEIYPILSRSNNIGWYGTHVPSKDWYHNNLEMKYWAGDVDVGPEAYEHSY